MLTSSRSATVSHYCKLQLCSQTFKSSLFILMMNKLSLKPSATSTQTHDHGSTLYLVQREHEVLLCRYVLQHDRQFTFILHGGVYAAIHLNTHILTLSNTFLCTRWTYRSRHIPSAAGRTTPLSESQTPRSQRSAPPLPGSCCVRSGRGATQTPAGFVSPAGSG